jgi:hypothetical protein
MQTECRDVWRQMALAEHGKGDAPDEMADFGFIGPWREVMKLCQDVIAWKTWPEPGGLMDQTEEFRADFRTFMKGYAVEIHAVRLEVGDGGNGNRSDDNLYEVVDFAELG